MNPLLAVLIENGFSEKEARLYLAMLELGPTNVQEIANKAGLNRASSYILIESLKRRGLIATFEKGKRTQFSAEPPERLRAMLDDEQHQLDQKYQRLKEAMPGLTACFNSSSLNKPNIRLYEGEEGISCVRDLFLSAKGSFYNFSIIDEALLECSKIDERKRMEIGHRKQGRSLLSVKPGCALPLVPDVGNWERRFIPYRSDFCKTGEIICCDDILVFVFKRDYFLAFVIQDILVINLYRMLYEYTWSTAQKNKTPKIGS